MTSFTLSATRTGYCRLAYTPGKWFEPARNLPDAISDARIMANALDSEVQVLDEHLNVVATQRTP